MSLRQQVAKFTVHAHSERVTAENERQQREHGKRRPAIPHVKGTMK